MKTKKSVIAAVAVSLTGLVAIALSGCEWFSFEKKGKEKNVADTFGHSEAASAWLGSQAGSSRADALQLYEEALRSGAIGSDVTFLEFLRAMNDDSASLSSPLRASVAIVAQSGLGSGVIYSIGESDGDGAEAFVITNHHVTEGSSVFYTYLYGDQYNPNDRNNLNNVALQASYVGGAEEEDIAVLSVKIPEEKLGFVQAIVNDFEKCDSDGVKVGERVYAVGNILGNGISVVAGNASVNAEYTGGGMLAMRINASVNHGNSGGGLFDREGRLAGIVFGGVEHAGDKDEIDVDGYGLAIPANRAIAVVQSIIDNSGSNDSKAAFYARLGACEAVSSKGVFVEETQSVEIVETVQIRSLDANAPFAKDVVGKNLVKITVTDHNGNATEYGITRLHQVKTVLYNVRVGDTVRLFFEDGSIESAIYDDGYKQFEQVG